MVDENKSLNENEMTDKQDTSIEKESTTDKDATEMTAESEKPAEEVVAESDTPAQTEEAPEEPAPSRETSDDGQPLRWYVVHAYSGFETFVKNELTERIRREAVEDKFSEIMVPTEEVVEMRAGQKRKSSRKFFPGYVLVKMVMDEQTWHLVKNVPRVLGFIGGTSERPAPISQKEADEILMRIEEGVSKPRPKVLFEPGEVVRVTDGPFTDFNGVVEEVNYEKSRLRVAVLIFGRSTPVELQFTQVEKST